jgi:predicted enzyme related to lactoylglutathione lyase
MITHAPALGHANENQRGPLARSLRPVTGRCAGPHPYGADMDTGKGITLGSVNVEADDPRALAAFWAQLLGSEAADEHDGHVFVPAREPGGFAMFFQPRTGPRPAHQGQHLDLTVPWASRGEEVGRAVGLGAAHRWDVLDEVPWVRWSTLSDPEGNLFCIAEHPPAAVPLA